MRGVEEVKTSVEEEVSNLDFKEAIDLGLEVAEKIPRESPLYIVYDGESSIPASATYWTILTLKPEYNLKSFEVQGFLSMIAPYTSSSTLLIFLEDPKYTVQLRDNVRIMENQGILVTSNEEVEEEFRGEIVACRGLREFQSLTYKTTVGVSTSLRLVESESPRRVEKLLWEISTIKDVLRDMLSYYEERVEDLVEEPDAILASEILKFQVDRAYDYKFKVYSWSQTSLIPRSSKVHVWKTSLEDQAYKWFVGESLRLNFKIKVLDFKTDPITSQLYSLIVSEFKRRLKAQLKLLE